MIRDIDNTEFLHFLHLGASDYPWSMDNHAAMRPQVRTGRGRGFLRSSQGSAPCVRNSKFGLEGPKRKQLLTRVCDPPSQEPIRGA